MIYQVAYGPQFCGYSTAMTYVEADSYAHAMSMARANACGHEKVQWVLELPNPSTQQQ